MKCESLSVWPTADSASPASESASARSPRFTASSAEAQLTEARNGPAAAFGLLRQLCADLPARPGLLLGDPTVAAWLARTALAAGDGELAARAARAAWDLADAHPGFRALAAAAAHSAGLVRYTGRARMVVDEDHGCLLGVTFVGPGVEEMIHSATIAVAAQVPVSRLWHAVPCFPSISEVWLRLLEAYLA